MVLDKLIYTYLLILICSSFSLAQDFENDLKKSYEFYSGKKKVHLVFETNNYFFDGTVKTTKSDYFYDGDGQYFMKSKDVDIVRTKEDQIYIHKTKKEMYVSPRQFYFNDGLDYEQSSTMPSFEEISIMLTQFKVSVKDVGGRLYTLIPNDFKNTRNIRKIEMLFDPQKLLFTKMSYFFDHLDNSQNVEKVVLNIPVVNLSMNMDQEIFTSNKYFKEKDSDSYISKTPYNSYTVKVISNE